MTVKELRETLAKYPDDIEVMLESTINDVEFNSSIVEVYQSGKLYLHGEGSVLGNEDIKRFWGVDVVRK